MSTFLATRVAKIEMLQKLKRPGTLQKLKHIKILEDSTLPSV